MPLAHRSSRPLPPHCRWLPFVACCALFLNGCLTTTEVTKLVRDSNYEMLLSAPGLETGGLSTNPGGDKSSSVDEASARIEAFLAQHPDDPAMAAALRLRQALLHLNHGAFALAQNSFAEVNPADLHRPRDRALYAARDLLLWWHQFSQVPPATFHATQRDTAEKTMRLLAEQSRTPDVASAPALRDYLLEMRAWIGLKLGLATADPAAARATLQSAINLYGESFSPAEITLVNATDFKNVPPYDGSTRRVLRARTLLETLAKAARDQPDRQLTLAQPAFQLYYAAALH